jgi:hypothetical protein
LSYIGFVVLNAALQRAMEGNGLRGIQHLSLSSRTIGYFGG